MQGFYINIPETLMNAMSALKQKQKRLNKSVVIRTLIEAVSGIDPNNCYIIVCDKSKMSVLKDFSLVTDKPIGIEVVLHYGEKNILIKDGGMREHDI